MFLPGIVDAKFRHQKTGQYNKIFVYYELTERSSTRETYYKIQ